MAVFEENQRESKELKQGQHHHRNKAYDNLNSMLSEPQGVWVVAVRLRGEGGCHN